MFRGIELEVILLLEVMENVLEVKDEVIVVAMVRVDVILVVGEIVLVGIVLLDVKEVVLEVIVEVIVVVVVRVDVKIVVG